MKISRVWAMPNKWTFAMPPVAELITRYVGGGRNWIDPFAGMNSPAEHTNDLNPNSPALSHMDAFDWVETLRGNYDGCLFDPPYSLVQVSRSYSDFGLKSRIGTTDPTASFKAVKDKISELIKLGGYVISCGWNSNGFGKSRGFKLEEILLVAHGGGHNDTIVTVERKEKQQGVLNLNNREDRNENFRFR
jgi:hypothetical protein